ncbi:MAG: DUF4114 domain-containing protein, partial [Candidatus Omnitrophica bacterium]|nr:DUF4114 domain-containing protein [Candidatus Omnitrophota bacterium]
TNLSGAGTGGGIGALGMGGGTESPFSNVPVTELISTSTGTGAAPGPVLTFAGTADGSFGHYVFLDLGTDTPAGESHLYEVYNALYGTSYPDNNAIEFLENGPAIGKGRFTSSEGSSIYFVARYAGARLNMKSYDIDDEYVMVTNLSGRSVIDTSCSMSYLVIPSESFGIWGQGSSLPRFYSEKMMNDDNEYHFIVLNAPVEYPNTYLIGFEDKSSGSDWDYNDFVFEIVDILPDYDATNIALLDYGQVSFAFGGTGSIIGSDIPFGIIGDYSNPNNHALWGSDFNGVTNDGATLLGSIGGISLDDSLEGLMLGMYVRPDDGIYRAGYISSPNITGLFNPTSGLFLASGNMTSYLDRPTSVLPEQFYFDSPYLNTGFSRGNIRGDLCGTVSVETISLIDQNWGLWRAGFGGTYTPPNSPFRSAMAGGYSDNEHAWIGILSGDLDSDRIYGSFNGLLMFETEGNPGKVTASTLSGDAIGTYIEIGEETGTWQALGAGQWVEVTDLLNETSLFGTEGLDALGDFVSIPI